jgi:hypothetical protein
VVLAAAVVGAAVVGGLVVAAVVVAGAVVEVGVEAAEVVGGGVVATWLNATTESITRRLPPKMSPSRIRFLPITLVRNVSPFPIERVQSQLLTLVPSLTMISVLPAVRPVILSAIAAELTDDRTNGQSLTEAPEAVNL